MKGKIFLIFMCAFIALCAGTSVAYCNTKSLGFDDNVQLVSSDDEKISIMDFDFYYEDINNVYKKLKSFLPEKSYNITLQSHHNVVYI